MASKYDALAQWLKSAGQPSVELTFGQIERILGFRLAKSYRQYQAA